MTASSLPSLPCVLDQWGPSGTPIGQVKWSRSFPMATEHLEFSAVLSRSGDELQARVVQVDTENTQDIFLATWKSQQGGWVFDAARLDGSAQTELQAVATFEDYVRALGVEAAVSAPRRGPGI